MCLNLMTEQLHLAHAKVGLLASDVWVCSKESNNYKKANLDLWLRYHEIEQKVLDLKSEKSLIAKVPRTVQDTIPQSRLASYGKYVYDEEKERMYLSDDEPLQSSKFSVCNPQINDLEIWELPEVEEEFKRLTNTHSSRWCSLSPQTRTDKYLHDSDNTLSNDNTFQWLTKTKWPDEILSQYPDLPEALQSSNELSLFNKDEFPPHLSDAEREAKLAQFPCPRYKIETHSDRRIHRCLQSNAIRRLWTSPHTYCPYGGELSPKHDLNADVPEFKPSTISRDVRRQYYPSIYDKSYVADLFPYTNHNLPSNPDPIDIYSEHDRPPANIPVFQTSPENYFGTRLKSIDIGKRAHYSLLPFKVSGKVSKRDPHQTVAMLEKIVNKIYNPRSNDFSIINSSCSRIDKIIQNVHAYCLAQNAPHNLPHRTNQKPLYSDVLMKSNEANSSISLPTSDNRYDELEREALAQYLCADSSPAPPTPPPVIPTLQSPPFDHSPIDSSMTKKMDQQNIEESPIVTSEPITSLESGSSWDIGMPSGEGVKPSESKFVEVLSAVSPNKRSPKSSPNSTISVKSFGSKRCHMLESTANGDSPNNKQGTWLKKKRRKTESSNKKKKNKKKTSINYTSKIISTQQEQCLKFFETEITYIRKFGNMQKIFKKCFLERQWKLVKVQISSDVEKLFIECLRGFSECTQWFKVLIVTKELKEDYRTNKKRLELVEQTVLILQKLISLLQQYVYTFSKIQSTIQCDQRLYFRPEKLLSQKPLTYMPETCRLISVVKEEEIQRANLASKCTWTKMHLYKLLSSYLADEVNSSEWNLGFTNNYHARGEQRNYQIQLNPRSYQIMSQPKKETRVNRKSLSVLDDIPIWASWQWRFLDGWAFKRHQKWDLSSINQFDYECLDLILTHSQVATVYEARISHSLQKLKALMSFRCEPFWTQQSRNLLSEKMMFLKVMVKSGEEWFGGDLWINKQLDRDCLMEDLKLSCECVGPCCVSVILAPLALPPSQPFPPPLNHQTILDKIVRGDFDIEACNSNEQQKGFCCSLQ